MNLSNGKIWPYAIAILIVAVFGACVTTIVVASTSPVSKSDLYMTDYQDADKNANDYIEARIAFDKKYKIEYISDGISVKNATLKYRVTDIDSNSVDDAKITVVFTRPNTVEFDQKFSEPAVKDGIYSFSNIELPKEGRWDIMAKVEVNGFKRYYNIKADTRKTEFSEY